MKTTLLTLALALATAASPALAKGKPKKPAKKKAPPKPPAVLATHKDGGIGVAGVVGYAYGGPSFGAHGWYGLGDLHLGADVLSTSAEVTAEGEGLREYLQFSISEFGGRGRYFFTETFNASAGLNFGSIRGDYGLKLPDDSLLTAPFTGNVVLLKAAVGNLWTIGDFVVGADWVVLPLWLSHSITIQESNETLSDGSTASTKDTAEGQKKIEDALRKRIELQLLMVHAGIVF